MKGTNLTKYLSGSCWNPQLPKTQTAILHSSFPTRISASIPPSGWVLVRKRAHILYLISLFTSMNIKCPPRSSAWILELPVPWQTLFLLPYKLLPPKCRDAAAAPSLATMVLLPWTALFVDSQTDLWSEVRHTPFSRVDKVSCPTS